MTVTWLNLLIGRDLVITGCLTVDPLETTDRLPKKSEVSGLSTINIRYHCLTGIPITIHYFFSMYTVTPVAVPKCDAGYEVAADGLSCYKLMKDRVTYNKAKEACVKDNAEIATIGGE